MVHFIFLTIKLGVFMEAWSRFSTMKTKNNGWDLNLFWSCASIRWHCFLNMKFGRKDRAIKFQCENWSCFQLHKC